MATKLPFHTYPEIESHGNKAGMEIIKNHATSEVWVATEKVHGTNFSFIYNGNVVSYARRRGLLQNDQSFFNFYATIAKKHSDKIPKVFELLKQTVSDLQYIQVFGEYYGGIYPRQSPVYHSKPIQKTIFYTPDLEFEAFDILYVAESVTKLLNYKEAVCIFELVQLPYAEIVLEGTLAELLANLNPDTYESTIYKKYGLQQVPGNLAEGFVLKPVEAIFEGIHRVCVKYKSKKHMETGFESEFASKCTTGCEDEELVAIVLSFVTQTRYDNVVSKLTEEEKFEHKIVGLVMSDTWNDFRKTVDQETISKARKFKEKITHQMRDAILKLISLYTCEDTKNSCESTRNTV